MQYSSNTKGANSLINHSHTNNNSTLKNAFTSLSNRFYASEEGKWSDHCNKKYGLEQPLWVWTHRALTHAATATNSHEDSARNVEVTRIENLLNWLICIAHTSGSQICVVVSSAQKAALKKHYHEIVGPADKGSGQPKHRAYGEAAVAANNKNNSTSSVDEAMFQTAKNLITFVDHQELVMLSHRQDDTSTAATTPQQHPDQNITKGLFGIVIYAFGLPLLQKHFDFMTNVGTQALRIAAGMVADAMIILCDAGWVYSNVLKYRTPEWFSVANDIIRQQLPVIRLPAAFVSTLSSPAAVSTIGIVSGFLPICCPQHPQKRYLADGSGPFEGFCDATCLKPYTCKENEATLTSYHQQQQHQNQKASAPKLPHLCTHRCHLSSQSTHTTCPYPCQRHLTPCGGECLNSCHDRCSCGHTIEVPLTCSHEIVVGFDKDLSTPITERVHHVFKGQCIDALTTPCTVMVPTICAHCAADFISPCHVLTAAGHTLNGTRSVVCDQCVKKQREIRAQVRGDLIREIHSKKQAAQAQLKTRQYIKQQGGGIVLQEGQRVVISDASAVREPLESDFPDYKFLDYYDPEFQSKVVDAHGLVMTAVAEGDELQYVIRLSSGLHVLVADTGLKEVKAIGNVASTGAMLMLTAAPGLSLDTVAASATATPTTTAFSTRVRPLFGKSAIILEPISFAPPENLVSFADTTDSTSFGSLRQDSYTTPDADAKTIKLSNVIGTIVGEDVGATLKHEEPMVQLQTTFWFVAPATNDATDQPTNADTEKVDGEPDARKGLRREVSGATRESATCETSLPNSSDNTNRKRKEVAVTVIIPAPLRLLEIIELREARITDTDRQIRGTEAMELFSVAALDAVMKQVGGTFVATRDNSNAVAPSPSITIRDAPALKEEMFSVVGIINHPIEREGCFNALFDLDEEGLLKTKGPCVVLLSRLKSSSAAVSSRRFTTSSEAVASRTNINNQHHLPSSATSVVIAPLLYVDIDEEAVAERQLTTQILARLDVEAKEQYDNYCENTSFANEDRRFADQQLLPMPNKIKMSPNEVGEPLYLITAAHITSNKMSPAAASESAALNQRPSPFTATFIQLFDQSKEGAALVSSSGAATDYSETNNATADKSDTPSKAPQRSEVVDAAGSPLLTKKKPVVGHVYLDSLTDQQRKVGKWPFAYSLPAPPISPSDLAAKHSRRDKMPKASSTIQLELLKKRQTLTCLNPTTKVVEEWVTGLNKALLEDQQSDRLYAKSANDVAAAECVKKGLHVGVAVGKH